LEQAIAQLDGLKAAMKIKKQSEELREVHAAVQKAFGERVLSSDIINKAWKTTFEREHSK
jgi:hypothetical protein